MSDDTSINFYRLGVADITVKKRSFKQAGQPVKWNIMLKGPHMGYSSFSIISSPCNNMQLKYNIDSIFGSRPFKARLLKAAMQKYFPAIIIMKLKFRKKMLHL